jgi:TolB protein
VARLFRVNQTNKKEQRLGIIADYVSTFPDGRIVYKGCTIEGACGLYVSPRDGGPMTLISDNTSDTAPTVSPDGSRIAFMSYTRDGAGNHEIFVMDSGGGNVSRLTNNSANDGLPAWSPGGNTIDFASDRAGEWAIWAMDADGNNQRQLFPMGGSPDGKVGSEIEISKGWLEERITWGK